MTAATFLQCPRLRAGVAVVENEAGFSVRLRTNVCQIDTNEAARAPLRQLFARLEAGIDHAQIGDALGDFADDAHGVIDQLDRFGYITEGGAFGLAPVVDTAQFLRALRAVSQGAAAAPHQGLTALLASGSVTRAQLIGYAVQYLHIVRHGPGLVAPVLNWVSEPALRAQLSDFLADEWRHDRLLAQSLAAVDINAQALRPSSMLPETFALIAQLGVRATTDPLALAALLFVYERPNPDFHRLYIDNCSRTGLPAAFVEPIVRHAQMNDSERHDDIAAALAAFVCPVSRERASAALCDAAVAVEHLQLLDIALARPQAE